MPLFEKMVISLESIDLNLWNYMYFVTYNINYVGCDYGTRYFACAKGVTFQSVIVGMMGWLDLERACA